MNVLIREATYGATGMAPPNRLGTAVQGSLNTYTMFWIKPDDVARDLTGAVITGTFSKWGRTYAVTGDLAVTGDAANGGFTWELSEEDVGTPGDYSLLFTATIAGTPYITLPIEWRVLENPAVNAVAPPAVVGIASPLAAWLSALRTAVQAFTSGNLVSNDGDGLTDSGIAAADVLLRNAGIVAVDEARDLATTDAGKILEASGTFAINCPDGLDTGFQVALVNVGSGTITITATTTLQSKDSAVTIDTQYAAATLYHRGSNVWLLAGDIA